MIIEQLRNIKSDHLPAVIAFFGTEKVFLEMAIEDIRQKIFSDTDEEWRKLNHAKFSLAEGCLIDDVLNSLNTLPLMAKRRLVELKDFSSSNELLSYIKNPNPTSILLLLFEKLDLKSEIAGLLQKMGALYIFDTPKKFEFLNFLKHSAEELDLKLSDNALDMISAMSGQDLLVAMGFLRKLAITFSGSSVSIDDIEANLIDMGEEDVFELARSISEGDLSKSLFMLARLKKSDESALKFLGVLSWQFRTILEIRHHLDAKIFKSETEIQKKMNLFGSRFLWMAKVAKRKPISFHINRLTKLVHADLALKSHGTAWPYNHIERIIYQSIVGF